MSNAELKAANANLSEQNAALQSQIASLEAQLKEAADKAAAIVTAIPTKTSKAVEQATAAIELLKQGTVTLAQLSQINAKYPSDPIYYARTKFGVEVRTNRAKNGGTTYSLVVKAEEKPAETSAPETPAEPAAEPTAEVPVEAVAAPEPVAEVAAQ